MWGTGEEDRMGLVWGVKGARSGAKAPSRLPFPMTSLMLLEIISKINDLSPSTCPHLGNKNYAEVLYWPCAFEQVVSAFLT